MIEFLRRLEIKEDVIRLFADASVDEEMMMELTEKDLERLGVKNFLTRRKILKKRLDLNRSLRRTTPQRHFRTDTWRYTIARCLIFLVIFFALHTTMNKYVLEPYLQRPRQAPPIPTNLHVEF